MSRFAFDPDESQVWIEGSSSVHPIHATATGVTGWIELAGSDDDVASASGFAGEVRVAVDRLASGNALDVREWDLRLPRLGFLRVHPDVVVRVRLVADRAVAPTGAV